MNTKITIGVVAVLLIGVGVFYKFGDNLNINLSKSATLDGNVALVNGVAIPQSLFDSQLALSITSFTAQGVNVEDPKNLLEIKTHVLNSLVNNELLAQKAIENKIIVSAEEVDNQVQTILAQAGSQEAFDKQLASANLTIDQLKTNLSKSLSIQKYILQHVDVNSITVTDEEVQKFYDDNKVANPNLPSFDEVKAQAGDQLLQNKRQEAINNFVASLREKADVETTTLN